MNQELFLNKYQPLYFDEFEGDVQMISILNALIKMDNLNLLFIGNIGTGKTTFLNAVIKEYYKGYNISQYKDNIMYINSLKEQGINYYRNDVKTFCQTCSCIKNKKKIIVLDDIDIINDQSQQVFRNCIDKYSHNVHFISSCVNSQKVIETLQSRLIILQINTLSRQNINNIMTKIIENEIIDVSQEAQEFVLNISNNNAKILINYMEKFKLLNEHISLSIATNVCTNISLFVFEEYIECLKTNKIDIAVKILYDTYDKGYSVMDILDNYFMFIKITSILTDTEKYDIIPIICKYITIFNNIHEDEIELALFTNNVYSVIHKLM
jgi:DNA polymerase III delta prime subunit